MFYLVFSEGFSLTPYLCEIMLQETLRRFSGAPLAAQAPERRARGAALSSLHGNRQLQQLSLGEITTASQKSRVNSSLRPTSCLNQDDTWDKGKKLLLSPFLSSSTLVSLLLSLTEGPLLLTCAFHFAFDLLCLSVKVPLSSHRAVRFGLQTFASLWGEALRFLQHIKTVKETLKCQHFINCKLCKPLSVLAHVV